MNFLQTVRNKIRSIGYSEHLSDYEKKRLIIFNNLNFTAFCLAIVRYLYTVINSPSYFTYQATSSNLALIILFVAIAILIHFRQYRTATITSFALGPALLTISGVLSNDSGTDMYLVLYMMLAFFFLHRIKNIAIAFGYCMIFFIFLRFKFNNHIDPVSTEPVALYYEVLNYFSSLAMIFFTMYLIKYQVWNYEKSIREKKELVRITNTNLLAKTKKIEEQQLSLLQKNVELTELNNVKVKLFSVISHDLRTSIYALKNIMGAFSKGGFSKEEMMSSLPGVTNEVDKSADLMENLLIWARNQLHESNIIFQHLELDRLVENTFKLFSKKAAEKGIKLINSVAPYTVIYADADMMKAILRNLAGNAIKFTNSGGYVEVAVETSNDQIRIIIKDNGVGISEEGIAKIFGERYYTTLGTERESGTGLGLMICRDFIASNNGTFDIKSKQGEGTSFIITLPDFKEE
jgi:two-component system sensor histidine kinase/response regulator